MLSAAWQPAQRLAPVSVPWRQRRLTPLEQRKARLMLSEALQQRLMDIHYILRTDPFKARSDCHFRLSVVVPKVQGFRV